MNETNDLAFLKGIVRRRRRAFLVSFSAVFLVGAVLAIALPSIYVSQSTILIENQLIPDDYVRTTITGFVEERLQMITQQIMSRSRLLEIIHRFNLYPEMRDRYTTEEIIQKMREDIKLRTISADVIDRRTGRPTSATIAFSLSYEGKDPAKVQKVASVLASLYLELNLRSREQRASTTTKFFEQELTELRKQMDRYQDRISTFKREHIGELPEYSEINLQAIRRLEQELSRIQMQIGTLQERRILLEGQLANVDPLKPMVTEEGKAVMHPRERLKYLRLKLLSLKSRFSEKHPDIKKLRNEIQKLEAEVGKEGDDALEQARRLDELTARLSSMKAKLGPRHPDVINLEKEIRAFSENMALFRKERALKILAEEKPDNPAYINLKTQIASTGLEIENLRREERRIEKQLATYRKRLEDTPLVEQEYNRLLRDHENAKRKYNELMNKLMEAKVAQGMEESQRGERFTIIDPAQLPERPYKPNRTAVALIAFVLALGAGAGTAALREALDPSVKSADHLAHLTGVPVLAVIDAIETPWEKRAKQRKRIAVFLAFMGMAVLGIYLFDRFVMPMDLFWIKLQRRLIKIGMSGFLG
ncbi:MAG: lipopolysaccharide biosynthesis protein [Deltaproteobacteria bacterium]|nr:lipopolysaccharide biosynthesis protein [Deltaproteobacteria bacterium]MBW2129619.1 lipopolysaccharide biosynthesis protein [Deltaproteobacteria bacterium]MBW2305147.1 lipopolysaccharide biosynthesis protein [Deltaproteobacteria bacterium]